MSLDFLTKLSSYIFYPVNFWSNFWTLHMKCNVISLEQKRGMEVAPQPSRCYFFSNPREL